ncbi:MAG: hypothetical protein K9J30_13520 [Bacteroidales bacterium]|nr:hypothetical protein [Bacteroidales bacterium]
MKKLLLSGSFLVIALLTVFGQHASFILDADTGNEMDDLYAIVKSLQDENAEVKGLISSHFNNVQLLTDSMWNGYLTADINTVMRSQELNEMLLNELDYMDIVSLQN